MINPKKYIIQEDTTLLPFLLETYKDQSRTTVKSLLTHRQITVNGLVVTKHDAPLLKGDEVDLLAGRRPEVLRHQMVRIVFEDDYIIVADKRNGLLSMGTDREREKTAYFILSEHVKRSDPEAKVFIIHRLDRETSGLMVMAKSEEIQEVFQRNWKNMVTHRSYVAAVEGRFDRKEGVICAPLAENKNLKVYVSNSGNDDAKEATTRYRILREGRTTTLLELELETGRKNQIRAHLEYIGHPVAGDKKYGSKILTTGRICLHAYKLHFIHPVTNREMTFDTPIPPLFVNL